MAKLTGVKTIDMVNGEITKVEYGSAVYAKVNERPEIGDLAVLLDGHGVNGGEIGAFYEVLDDTQFGGTYIDTPSRGNVIVTYRKGYANTYRKDTEVLQPFAEMITTKVDAVEKRVEALEGVKDSQKLAVGDRVKALVVGQFKDIVQGEFGKVTDLDSCVDGDGDPYTIEVKRDDGMNDFFRPQDLELVDAAKPAEDEVLKVGDYAKVVGRSGTPYYVTHEFDISEIVRVELRKEDGILRCGKLSGDGFDFLDPTDLVKATEAEVAVATAPPKPKTGDIVVITANTNSSRNKVGDIGKVGATTEVDARIEVVGGPTHANWTEYSEMRLATPAEIEKYEASVVQKPKGASLKVGDTVKLTLNGKRAEYGLGSVSDGDIGVIKRIDTDGKLRVDFPAQKGWNGRPSEFVRVEAKTDCLFTKAGRKPNEYRKGDVVRVVDSPSASPVGTIIEIESVRFTGSFRGSDGFEYMPKRVEIVCFAENRVDTKEVA